MAIILKDITPSMNNIVITAYIYSEEDIDKEIVEEGMARHTIGSLKELQEVLFAGPACRQVKKGSVVQFNPKNYAIKQHPIGSIKDDLICDNPVVKYRIRYVKINNEDCIFANEQDIDFVVNDMEEKELPKKSVIITPDTSIKLLPK